MSSLTSLGTTISQTWTNIQGLLFPLLEERINPITEMQLSLCTILEVVRIEQFTRHHFPGLEGRPFKCRAALARAFIAKHVYNLATTRMLIDRLLCDKSLRSICGWESIKQVPSESTFSRAFEEFAESQLPQRVHEALIQQTYKDKIVQHTSTDSTAIEAREKAAKSAEEVKKTKKKRGRPKKDEERELPEPKRLEKQSLMSLEEMIKDLPTQCDIGTKKNSKGFKTSWKGYKLHISSADGAIPLGALLTSASLHDSQVAIPLIEMTSQRTEYQLYDLYDAAYDAQQIYAYSQEKGRVPIIDKNPRCPEIKKEMEEELKRRKVINFKSPEDIRYKERTTAERVNSRLKDEFGGRVITVKGHAKIMCHLMFGLLALTADQLMLLFV